MTQSGGKDPWLLARFTQCAIAATALAGPFRAAAFMSYHSHPTDHTLDVVGNASMVFVYLYTVAVVAFLLWFGRCRRNADTFAPGTITYPLGWAIGAWFVPLVNLWEPRRTTLDTYRVSAADTQARVATGLVNAWWTAWIAYWAVALIGSATGQQYSPAFNVLSEGLNIFAAVLAILVIHRISALQRTKIRDMQITAPHPTPTE